MEPHWYDSEYMPGGRGGQSEGADGGWTSLPGLKGRGNRAPTGGTLRGERLGAGDSACFAHGEFNDNKPSEKPSALHSHRVPATLRRVIKKYSSVPNVSVGLSSK